VLEKGQGELDGMSKASDEQDASSTGGVTRAEHELLFGYTTTSS
jgi:hypothetical protein